MYPSKRENNRREPEAGFTLFEVVIALAIASLGIMLLLAATSQGLGNAQTADRYFEAVRRAQSHLAEIGVTSPLKPGQNSGEDGGGFTWRTRILEPVVRAPAPARPGAKPLALYTVEASIFWQDGAATREVSLQSKRMGSP